MPGTMRPGDVLADRYRLVDLLSESRGGRFWRAWDGVLARHVALHLIGEDDDRAPRLLEAARRSATLHDPHLLRVLDADVVDGLCYVVNEWGEGESLDTMIEDGPLTPRRAAWIAGEVGSLLVAAHEHGIAHGRLVPENVLVDESGAVKVIGLAVDAALHGLPTTGTSADVVDLVGVLYAAMTGRWPGVSQSEVPTAPREHGHPLRPRQVRAGVPRVLDALCDQVLAPPHGTSHRAPTTARSVTDALLEYVGDPAAAAEAEAARHRGGTSSRLPRIEEPLAEPDQTAVLPAVTPRDDQQAPGSGPGPAAAAAAAVAGAAGAAGAAAAGRAGPDEGEDGAEGPPEDDATTRVPASGQTGDQPLADQPPDDESLADEPSAGPADAGGEPAAADADQTQAGVPVFYDEIEDVGWLTPEGNGKPPPPPPFEESPERPLFAPDPPDGRPARVPRAGGAAETSAAGATGTGAFWPWDGGASTGATPVAVADDEEEPARVPGRSWLRIAAVVAVALVVVIAMAWAFDRGRGGDGFLGDEEEPTPSPSQPADAEPLRVTASDFDPQGDPPTENPDLVPLAVDGDATTAWQTSTYDQNLGPDGLKTGVGLLLDLGEAQDVVRVQLTFTSAPTAVQLWVSEGEEQPTSLDGLTQVAQGRAGNNRLTLELDEPTTSRWMVVWLTSLPEVDGGFRGQVADVVVRG